ncbi:MAG: hypothetical protein RRB12_06305 [Armatimonadota bacterium]|nr:hypothetical protein [Armatimonadota bacterium]
MRREIALPLAIGIIVVVAALAVFFLWRKTSPPTEGVLQKWAPHPQLQRQVAPTPANPR